MSAREIIAKASYLAWHGQHGTPWEDQAADVHDEYLKAADAILAETKRVGLTSLPLDPVWRLFHLIVASDSDEVLVACVLDHCGKAEAVSTLGEAYDVALRHYASHYDTPAHRRSV